jgi:hypothetical protein
MNEVLTNAVLEVFKKEILGDSINALTKQISDALADKVFTEKEKLDINSQVKVIADTNKELWQNLTQALEIGNITEPGLSGAITRQITEETGTELAGLMRKISDDNRQNRDYNKLAVDHLVGIESNTYNTVQELQKAVIELQSISKNTKPVYANDLGGG